MQRRACQQRQVLGVGQRTLGKFTAVERVSGAGSKGRQAFFWAAVGPKNDHRHGRQGACGVEQRDDPGAIRRRFEDNTTRFRP